MSLTANFAFTPINGSVGKRQCNKICSHGLLQRQKCHIAPNEKYSVDLILLMKALTVNC